MMILKSALVGLLGMGAVGAFTICDFCRAPADARAASVPVVEPEVR